jgi:hypothetical protein
MRILKNILLSAFLITSLVISGSVYASSVVMTNMESKKVDDKYSLKNLGSLAHKTASFYTLKASLEFKGFSNNTGLGNAAYLKYNKGNVTYVIPYRYKVILPRFKAPSQNLP